MSKIQWRNGGKMLWTPGGKIAHDPACCCSTCVADRCKDWVGTPTVVCHITASSCVPSWEAEINAGGTYSTLCAHSATSNPCFSGWFYEMSKDYIMPQWDYYHGGWTYPLITNVFHLWLQLYGGTLYALLGWMGNSLIDVYPPCPLWNDEYIMWGAFTGEPRGEFQAVTGVTCANGRLSGTFQLPLSSYFATLDPHCVPTETGYYEITL